MQNSLIVLTFIAYLLVILGIGYWSWRKTGNLSDYILGGRTLGRLPTALSAGASDMSGWLLLGLPGAAYASGLSAAWIALGLLVGTWCNWLLVAPRLRQFTERANDALTLPDYFEKRFDDNSHLLRIMAALVIVIFFLIYTSSGLVAGGKLFATVFGFDYQTAVFIGMLAVVSYTLFGGFIAVSWTDVVQGLLMLAALLFVPLFGIQAAGGWSEANAAVSAVSAGFLDLWTDRDGVALGGVAIVSALAWGLGYFGQPHILARFMAIRSAKQLPGARRIAVSWTALSLMGSVLVGLLATVVLPSAPDDPERVFMLMIETLFHPLLAGVLLAAILAAIMSTADSQLLVAASALSEDFYHKLWRKQASEKTLVRIGRGAVVVIALIATGLALDPSSGVLALVSYAWAGFGAAFGPVILFSLFWPAMSRHAALAGMLTGALTVVVWKQLTGGIYNVYELLPGFLFASLAIIVTTLIKPRSASDSRQFFGSMTH